MIRKILYHIKSLVPQSIKNSIKFYLFRYSVKKAGKVTRSHWFMMGAINHGNLGDQAINIAQAKFVKDYLKDTEVFEVIDYMFRQSPTKYKKIVKDSPIIISGGGNMGIEWFEVEELIRLVIQTFPNNKVVIFPQTIYYGDSERGIREFENSKKIYSRHKDLTICAREELSFNIMKEAYPSNKILLVPDIVTYLDETNPRLERKGGLLCLRKDVESALKTEQKQQLKHYLRLACGYITETDTVLEHYMPLNKRQYFLSEKLKEFKTSQLVITDRLHGMVFAAITGTPCVALSNYNHKVKGVYAWLKHLDYIAFSNTVDEVPVHIERLAKLKDCHYENQRLLSQFNELAEVLR